MLDINKLQNIEVDGIDTKDYPEFCDAFICYAEHENGNELNDAEYDELNDEHREFVYETVMNHLF